jgi:hypothetical protein
VEAERSAVYALKAAKLMSALRKRGMEGRFAPDRSAAAALALSLAPEGSRVAWGGSVSCDRDLGIIEALRKGPYEVIDRDAAKTPAEKEKAFRDSFFADAYFMGTNAISQDGELVNVDANGNRVAALSYGPRRVIVIAGCNKICADLPQAMRRAREEAAPPNVLRLGYQTPCRIDGICHDCLSEECICCQILVTRKSRVPGRIQVILVGEDLGF